MAGSRRQFEYTSDNGLGYEVQIDETTGEDANFGFAAVADATIAAGRYLKVSSKRPIEARYVIGKTQDADGRTKTATRVVGSVTAPIWIGNGGIFVGDDGLNYSVTAKIGEKRLFSPELDTGLIDGDVESNLASAG